MFEILLERTAEKDLRRLTGIAHDRVISNPASTGRLRIGGGNIGNYGGVHAEPIPWQGQSHSIGITLSPLGLSGFKRISPNQIAIKPAETPVKHSQVNKNKGANIT